MEPHSWCEISRGALEHNVKQLRRVVGSRCMLAPVVKANGYGHGITLAAAAFLSAGADWLCVNDLAEANLLRRAGLGCPIYVLGWVAPWEMEEVCGLGVRIVVYDSDAVVAAAAAGRSHNRSIPLHIKVETGNHRQGLPPNDALALARLVNDLEGVYLEGITTHFADIEDTTDHTYATKQLTIFEDFIAQCSHAGLSPSIRHCSNSAATILWPNTYFDMVRTGIASYGMWPSKETLLSAVLADRHGMQLRPALAWKARIAQVKTVPKGSFIGYGRTYQATHDARIAVITCGYYDGYDRRLSNLAYVLVNGVRAPVRGRICMNLMMVDTTDVDSSDVSLRAGEVTLLGDSAGERISAEQMAEWIGTINYEVVARINERLPRREVM